MSADTLIALGAFLVAGLSALGTYQLSRRQTKIEEELGQLQLKELQARDADRATARILCKYRREDMRLLVTNTGGGQARNVEVELDCPNGGRSAFPDSVLNEFFPIAVIDPEDYVPIIVSFAGGCTPPLEAVVRWLDPDGTQREEQVLVTEL